MQACKRSEVQPDAVDAQTKAVDGEKVATSDVSRGRSICKDRSGVAPDTKAPVFSRVRTDQAISDLYLASKEIKLENYAELEGVAVHNDAHPVLDEVHVGGSRSSVGKISSSTVENADPKALQKHIQEVQTENKEVLSRSAGKQSVQINTLLKLCLKRRRNRVVDSEVKMLPERLVEALTEQKKIVTNKQAAEDVLDKGNGREAGSRADAENRVGDGSSYSHITSA